ncbi:Fasciclin-like arabinogalactan protein 11 [Linum grandiflorum]
MAPLNVLLFLVLLQGSCSAQSPAAAPAPPGPVNITKVLEKAGQFSVFIRLLRATREDLTLNGQLNNSNNAVTIFAPSDSAFTSLKSGTLNSLNDQEKSELIQFHIVPMYLSSSTFQTVSNPVTTQAGTGSRLALNVTTSGNSVNITTGMTNTSVSGTVYTDGQLAVYQVDQVLLPVDLFTPKPPAPAPAPEKAKKKKKAEDDAADSPGGVAKDASDGGRFMVVSWVVAFGVGLSCFATAL